MALRRIILNTKLTPPSSRRLLLRRPQLLDRVMQAADRRLTLVTAPAGYGKTSLLCECYKQLKGSGAAPGWVSVDKEENDLSLFLTYFLSALEGSDPSIGRATFALLNTGVSLPPNLLRDTFINDLHALERDTYVFLDDFHLISDPLVLEVVDAVLRAPLDHIHLIVSARDYKNLSLGRLRANGQLEIVNANDLAFSDGEALEFFEQISSEEVAVEQIQLLRKLTEGWAVGLQLAAIAMRDVQGREAFLTTFSGANNGVADFLADEVIKHQPSAVQEFLQATSILRRFNTSLCRAVTGRTDCCELLMRLESANLFVFALDNERYWYRYHHLFAELLQKRLRDERPELIPELNLRASEWFDENGLHIEAIEHAFSADAIDRAAALLDRYSHRLFSEGQTATLIGFAARLPADVAEQLPRLQLDCAWYSELCWKFDEAQMALDRVRAELSSRLNAPSGGKANAENDFLLEKLAHREMMLALLSDDVLLARKKAQEWLDAEKNKEHFMCASAGTAVMLGNREQYRCEGTEASGKMLHDLFVQGGAIYGVVFHQCVVGQTFVLRGELDKAEQAYARSRQAAKELHGEGSALYLMPSIMLAEVCYEQNRLKEAHEIVCNNEISTDFGFVDKLISGFITRAKLAALDGRQSEAGRVLEEAFCVADRFRFSRLHANVLNEHVRQLIAQGRAKDAAAALRDARSGVMAEAPIGPREGATTEHELLAIAHARVWLETGREGEAIGLLKQWHSYTKTRHCYRPVIRLAVLLAKANLRVGQPLVAQRLLAEALKLGEGGGFVRAFLDEGSSVVELLGELRKADSAVQSFSRPYLNRILEIWEPQRSNDAEQGLAAQQVTGNNVELVTEREIQILNLGSRGLQNLDIAETLCLAESTVKWYWQRIYDKLEVRRRADAIRRARHLQWIR